MALADFVDSNRRSAELTWPDSHDLERSALNDISLSGPKAIIPFSRSIEDYSQLIKSGVPVLSESQFVSMTLPTLNRSLRAGWGNSVDIGGSAITTATPSPKRVSAYVVVSKQLSHQSPLVTGAFLESQIMSSLGQALDHAAIAGSGVGEEPLGLFNDPDIPTRPRDLSTGFTDSDVSGMERSLTEAYGDQGLENFLWIASPGAREALRVKEGVYKPIWDNSEGPLGYEGIASVHATGDQLALVQKNALTFVDFNRLHIETVADVDQATAGYFTLLISTYHDFVAHDTNGAIILTPAV
jgi:HK97 family phage major capsid protein